MTRFIRKKVEVANPEASMVVDHGRARNAKPHDSHDSGKSNIFLVGLRGSGKTTLGRMAARELGLVFVDTDEEVVRRAGQDIADIVAAQGWEAFRALESEVLKDVCARTGQVVATGGGIVLDPANLVLMEGAGVVFYLMADIKVLAQRLDRVPLAEQRPALTDLSPVQELARCFQERGHLYMRIADHVLLADREPEALLQDFVDKLGLTG